MDEKLMCYRQEREPKTLNEDPTEKIGELYIGAALEQVQGLKELTTKEFEKGDFTPIIGFNDKKGNFIEFIKLGMGNFQVRLHSDSDEDFYEIKEKMLRNIITLFFKNKVKELKNLLKPHISYSEEYVV